MTGIASKNLYDLLGNDPELDPDREPEPPTKAVDKSSQRSGKRNAGPEAPSSDNARARGGRGGRDGFGGSDQAFRDRGAGSYQNRSRPSDDGARRDRNPDRVRDPAEHRDAGNRGRGSRGGRGYGGRGARTARDDRHSRTGVTDTDKQVAHGWGGNDGESEWNDEKAGEAIAKEEEKEGFDTNVPPPVDADGKPINASGGDQAEPEPEDTTKSYDAYLEELAQKKLNLGPSVEPRKPNQGNKKQPQGKAIEHNEEEEAYFVGGGGKNKRTKERKEKNRLDLDDSRMYAEPDRGSGGRGRGGRGRGGEGGHRGGEGGHRGGEGGHRGGEGGHRGEGGFRGEGRGRGRGGRGRGDGDRGGGFRGGERGGRGGRGGPTPNLQDKNAFPTLGS